MALFCRFLCVMPVVNCIVFGYHGKFVNLQFYASVSA